MEKSEQEKFLVEKMVARAKLLNHENDLFAKRLDDASLSDEDYDLYQGMMDKNIGELNGMRRMEDALREWRDSQRDMTTPNPQAVCGRLLEAGECRKAHRHMGECLV